MAEVSVDQDQFCCSVCLHPLKDPVTIPCGHSYCMNCITEYWDLEDRKGFYSCPQCRKTFTPRPALGKNVMIAEMVEKLKNIRLQAALVPPPVPAYHRPRTGSGDVQCDSCTGRKQKAVKSCLECRSSYCQNHLEQHDNLFRGKIHNLMDATGRLQEIMCPRHDKMLDIYCRTDQRCICMLCLVDEHKNHDTVSTATERNERQRHFEEMQRNIQKRIQQREKDLQELIEAVATHKRSAHTAVMDSERIFTEVIRSFERRRSEVTQLIRDQERAAVSRAEERLERMQKEINDLRRKDTELKQLSHTQDHVHFLQSLSSVSLSDSLKITISSLLSFDDVVKSVSQLRDKLQQFCSEETEKISGTVKTVQVIMTPEYHTREEIQQLKSPTTKCSSSTFKFPGLQMASQSMAALRQEQGRLLQSTAMKETEVWDQHTVTLHRDQQIGFGFTISGGLDAPFQSKQTPIVISDVHPAGPADRLLQKNDRVVAINGVSMDNVSHSFAVQQMKKSGKNARITISRKR